MPEWKRIQMIEAELPGMESWPSPEPPKSTGYKASESVQQTDFMSSPEHEAESVTQSPIMSNAIQRSVSAAAPTDPTHVTAAMTDGFGWHQAIQMPTSVAPLDLLLNPSGPGGLPDAQLANRRGNTELLPMVQAATSAHFMAYPSNPQPNTSSTNLMPPLPRPMQNPINVTMGNKHLRALTPVEVLARTPDALGGYIAGQDVARLLQKAYGIGKSRPRQLIVGRLSRLRSHPITIYVTSSHES